MTEVVIHHGRYFLREHSIYRNLRILSRTLTCDFDDFVESLICSFLSSLLPSTPPLPPSFFTTYFVCRVTGFPFFSS